MDDIEVNNEPEAPVVEEDENYDSADGESQNEMEERNSYGGDYLGDDLLNWEDDNYDWGNAEEIEELLVYLKDRPTLLDKFDTLLKDINTERDLEKKERKIKGYKSILRDTVDQLKTRDKLNEDAWDEEIILEEREKFLWEQKLNNVNNALEEHGIKLDPNNKELYNYLKENLTETFTSGDEGRNLSKNINGYKYSDKKIIQRSRDRKTFRGVDNKEFNNFLERMKRFTTTSARSELIDILGDDQNVEITAKECIEELREVEKSIIRRSKNYEDLTDARSEIGKIEDNINDLKENKKFNLGRGFIEKTLQGKIAKFKGWVKENETTLGVGGASLLISIVSGLATSIPLIEKIKDGAKYVKQVGKNIEKFGKKISLVGNKMDAIFKEPTKAVGAIVGLTGVFLDDLAKIIVPLILIVILGIIIYYINKWIGVF